MTQVRDDLDAEDMRRLAEGQDLALSRLMTRWSTALISYLTRFTGSHSTAQDLAQEAFVRVYRHRLDFRYSQKFSTWLFAIAGNLARNHLRWQERHPEALQTPESMLEVLHMSPNESPDQQAIANERLDAIQKAVAQLPTEMREVLLLITYHGMSQSEVAKVQGTTPKAVEVRLYRARKMLRELLGDHL